MVYYPELSVWVSQEPFPNKEMEGRLPKSFRELLTVQSETTIRKVGEQNDSGRALATLVLSYRAGMEGSLPVPKEVNRKKDDKIEAASLTPLGSSELHSPGISYLHSF
uniref:Neuronal regeneration-related protein n=1 Tax=Felis catus TaxID=9685 RepID=A0ABI7YWM8_FELCA